SGSRSRGSSAVSEEGTLGEGACSENTSLERNPKILEQLERQQQMQLQQQQQLQQLQEQLQQQLSHAAAVSEARAPHGETEAAVASTEHEELPPDFSASVGGPAHEERVPAPRKASKDQADEDAEELE
ncbi:unnamed protein product, partial [Polarella glacialis]